MARVAVRLSGASVWMRLNDEQLNRWSETGQALSPVGIFFSGIAFIGVAIALLIQQRELQNQHAEISIARDEQARASEVVMRQLHTDLIKMAIDDPELLAVWPDMAPGITGSKKDQYCNLIPNLQKVASCVPVPRPGRHRSTGRGRARNSSASCTGSARDTFCRFHGRDDRIQCGRYIGRRIR